MWLLYITYGLIVPRIGCRLQVHPVADSEMYFLRALILYMEPQSPSRSKGAVMVAGVYFCYLLLNIFNERLHKQPYPRTDNSGHDFFSNQVTIMAFTSGLATSIGAVYNRVFPPTKRVAMPFSAMMKQSGVMFVSSVTVNKSLNYLSFIVVSMTKSCSLLSVVVVGLFFTKVKSQHIKVQPSKVIVAGLIVSGTILFQTAGTKTSNEASPANQIIGMLMLMVSLVTDGILPEIQARTKQRYNPTTMQLYEYTHRGVFLIAITVSLLGGGMLSSIRFWMNHTGVVEDCACLVVLGSLGHIFIFGLVRNFSQFVAPLVLSIRKMLSVFLSMFWFGHKINALQTLGIVLVFGGALFQILYKPKPQKTQETLPKTLSKTLSKTLPKTLSKTLSKTLPKTE